MKKQESILCKKILDWMNAQTHTFFFKTHGSGFLQAGIPDLVGSIWGNSVVMEIKLPGKEDTVTKIQRYYLDKFRSALSWSFVVTSLDQAHEIYDIVSSTVHDRGK
jgi:hypothetical protein